MGWLDLIFGKKSARALKQVQKATASVGGKTKPAAKGKRPKVEWQKSEKGNDTAEVDGFRVTVFRQDDGWNYCVSEILDADDVANGVEEVPEFGDGFETKAGAKKAALENFS